jgi:3-hydroxy-9,10-secoandrosta-1,3,5(10)-triene-9,17-dione monooxygenase reductase component
MHNATDAMDYRKALSSFGTGVTVVTAHHEGQDWAMTCNSFSSVSLKPRLVLWSIRKEASSLPAFTQSGGFTVSVLASAQADLAMQFAKGNMPERFAGVKTTKQASQRLRLDGAVAWFDCALQQLVDAGDHHINRGVRGAQPGAGTHFFHRGLADQLGGHQLHHALASGFGLGEVGIPLAQVAHGAIDGLQQIGLADSALAHLGH